MFDPNAMAPFLQELTKLEILPKDDQLKLVRKAQKGDEAAREKLIKHNMRFILKIAKKWSASKVPTEDIVALAAEGLNHAIDRFKPGKKTAFLSYAVHWMEARIRNHMIADHSIVKIGTTQAERTMFFDKRNLDPNASGERGEFARRMQASFSLDAPVRKEPGEDLTFKDILVEPSGTAEDQFLEKESSLQAKQLIGKALDQLDPRERYIIQTRHLKDEEDAPTLKELGEHFGFSRERVRQLESRALKKMTAYLQSQGSPSGSFVL